MFECSLRPIVWMYVWFHKQATKVAWWDVWNNKPFLDSMQGSHKRDAAPSVREAKGSESGSCSLDVATGSVIFCLLGACSCLSSSVIP